MAKRGRPKVSHCRHGHEYTAENTRKVKLKSGYMVRQCKLCRNAMDRKRYRDNPKRQAAIRLRAMNRRQRQSLGTTAALSLPI